MVNFCVSDLRVTNVVSHETTFCVSFCIVHDKRGRSPWFTHRSGAKWHFRRNHPHLYLQCLSQKGCFFTKIRRNMKNHKKCYRDLSFAAKKTNAENAGVNCAERTWFCSGMHKKQQKEANHASTEVIIGMETGSYCGVRFVSRANLLSAPGKVQRME